MENRILTQPASKIREIARHALKGKWKAMVLGVFIYYVFSTLISSALDLYFSSVQYITLANGETIPMEVTYASPIYEFVLAGPLLIGMMMFLLAFFRNHTVDYALTFEGFSHFGKGIVLYLVYTVKIFLWSLLFIIPGLIASFRYSQAFYLQADHPEWTASQCIAESSRLMKGNKAKLFGLNLSFIGWYILTTLPATVLLSFVDVSGLMSLVVSAVFSIPILFVDLYVMMSETAFYELLTGNLVVREYNPFEEQQM